MEYHFDGTPKTPLEEAEDLLVMALASHDATKVRALLEANPDLALGDGTRKAPLARSVERLSAWGEELGRHECIVALVEHGARLTGEYDTGRTGPLHTLVERGELALLRKIHDKGLLAGSITEHNSGSLLAAIFTAAHWNQVSGRDYPVDGMLELLLDAGAPTANQTSYPSLLHFAVQSGGMAPARRPASFEAACLRLYRAISGIEITPQLLWTAWENQVGATFQELARHYDAPVQQEAMERLASMKPADRLAKFQADVLSASAAATPHRNSGPRL